MESKLVIVLFVHCLVAIFIVSHSLLKRRILVDEKSNSENVPVGNLFSYDEKYTGWLPAVNEKVVLVVIDALRNDFAFKEESKLEIVHNEADFFKSIFLSNYNLSASSWHCIWNLSHLPGIVLQLQCGSQIWAKYPATSAFFGDNTWTELFPVILAAEDVSKGFHSFNMFDLNFVDDSVYECIDKFLNEGKMHSKNFLALHLLGLDHAGHTFDAKHESIQGKLAEYNTFIRRITNEMPQNASLFIFGDHGMTESGDHGGESWNELATCICHWRKGWESQDEQKISEFQVLFERVEQIRRKYSQYAAGINQVDFAATLCIIMGLPIPFENIGSLIPEILIRELLKKYNSREKILQFSIDAQRLQLYATKRYLERFDSTKFVIEKALIDDLCGKIDLQNLEEAFCILFEVSQQISLAVRKALVTIDFGGIVKGFCLLIVPILFLFKELRRKNTLFFLAVNFYSAFYISNSHIEGEGKIIAFLLSFLALCRFNQETEAFKVLGKKFQILLFVAFIRFADGISSTMATVVSLVLGVYLVLSRHSFERKALRNWAFCFICASGELSCSFFNVPVHNFQKAIALNTLIFPSNPFLCSIVLIQRPKDSLIINNLLVLATGFINSQCIQKRENISFLSLFSWHAFFFAGHSWQPTAIQWDRAFFGAKSFNQIWNGFCIFHNSFSLFLLPFFLAQRGFSWMFLVECCKLLWCCICCWIHARHLMAFAIFIPRYILQSCVVVVVGLGTITLNSLTKNRKVKSID